MASANACGWNVVEWDPVVGRIPWVVSEFFDPKGREMLPYLKKERCWRGILGD
jgi:hypothetical protein